MSTTSKLPSDRYLVRQCLKQDGVAWHLLHQRYHTRLLAIIRRRLRPETPDPENAAEEIASAVWSSLFVDDGRRLRPWDRQRSRLLTYLTALARQQHTNYYRLENQPQRRTVPLQGSGPVDAATLLLPIAAELDDFLSTLTPAERRFVELHRLQMPDQSAAGGMSPALRKRQQRVLQKLCKHLYGD